ncbi:hypothetical protein BGZ73_005794 [Actinomortierella ambigua]|nr:hypothetical protein BGZ73_005794 [Actinomortierella ambigua]
MRRAGSHSAYTGKGRHLVWSRPRLTFDRLPHEVKIQIFRRSWRSLALDGSLWRVIDTTRYYRTIEDRQLMGLGRAAAGFLRYANFRGCTQLSSNTIRIISEQCPNIRRLDLTGCRSLSSKAIADVCMNLPQLVFFNVSGLDVVNNYTLQAMGVYCRGLQVLNIAHCRHISGSGVAKLARSCRELRDLNMAGCHGLEDRLMMVLGMHLGKLRELCLNGCQSLTDRGVLALLSGLSSAARACLEQKRTERLAKAAAAIVTANTNGKAASSSSDGPGSGDMSMDARIKRYYRRLEARRRGGSQDNGLSSMTEDDEDRLLVQDDDSDFELDPIPWDDLSDHDPEELLADLDELSDSDQESSTSKANSQTVEASPNAGNNSSNSVTNNNNGNQNNSISGNHTRLTYLGLSNCRLLTNESLFVIGDQCGKTLERLELASCERLNDDGLIYLARHSERLRFLDLEDVNLLTDLTLREFALRLNRLERISLSYCENVTDQGVGQLFKGALVQQLNPPGGGGGGGGGAAGGGGGINNNNNPGMAGAPAVPSVPTIHRVGGSKHLVHIELDNCLLITDRLLLDFATAIEERRVQALERWRNKEEEQTKRRAAREMRLNRYKRRLERRKGKAKQTDPIDVGHEGGLLDDPEMHGSLEHKISQDLSGVLMTEETLVFESRRSSWAVPSPAISASVGARGTVGRSSSYLSRSISGVSDNNSSPMDVDSGTSTAVSTAVTAAAAAMGMSSSSSMVGSWPILPSASASSSSLHLPPVQASTSLSKIAIKKPRPCCVSHSSSCSLLVTTGSSNDLSSSLSSSPGTIHSSPFSDSTRTSTCTCPCVMTTALSMANKVNQELHSNPHVRASLTALRQMTVPPLAWSWTSYALHRRHKILKQRIQQRHLYYCQQVAYFQQLYRHHQQKQQQLYQQRMDDEDLVFDGADDFQTGYSHPNSPTSSDFASLDLAKQGLPPSILHRHPWMNQRRAVIQVFDCRNITLDGVEAALKKVQTRDFVIKSYYSWANPAIADPNGHHQQQQQQQQQQHQQQQHTTSHHHPLTLGALIAAFGGGGGGNNRQQQQGSNGQGQAQAANSGNTPFDYYLDYAFDYGYGFPHDEEVDEAAVEEQETTNGSPGLGSVVAAVAAIHNGHSHGAGGSNGGGGGGSMTPGLTTHASQLSLQQHLQQQQELSFQHPQQLYTAGAAVQGAGVGGGASPPAGLSQRARRRVSNPRNSSCIII